MCEELTDCQLVIKLPIFYGVKRTLRWAKKPATGPYREPHEFSPHPRNLHI
jgi:hypothetical protein